MATLNKKPSIKRSISQRTDLTKNYEGGVAFEMSSKAKLYSMVASWLVGEPKFYKEKDELGIITDENQDQIIYEQINKVLKTDPDFVLKLAIYARNKLYLRSAPEVLLCEASLADKGKSKPHIRKVTPLVVTRADQLTNCIAYVQSRIGNIGDKSESGSLPASLKRGLSDAFNNFNEYKLSKYNNQNKSVKLRDVVKIVHPVPKDKKQSELYRKLMQDNLEPAKTWETIISNDGSSKESWTAALDVMPYMAGLRNFRNLLQHDVDVSKLIAKIKDPQEVKNSKQFPFRFYSAYKQVQEFTENRQTNNVLNALEKALELSVANVPHLKGTTFITADNSASMQSSISKNSSVEYIDIANLLMAMANRICDESICSVFGDTHKVVNLPSNAGIISNMQVARNTNVGHSTNAYLAIRHLIEKQIMVDRIILFSDMQCYDSRPSNISSVFSTWLGQSLYEELQKYKRIVNPNVFTYSFDLSGYGTLQVPENDKNSAMIAGWSDKVLNYIPIFESDGKTALEEIEKISL